MGLAILAGCSRSDSPAQANQKAPEKEIAGVIEVKDGSVLERDIIPQLCQVFDLSEQAVKESLASAGSSELIDPNLKDFRKMEGMIPPGKYEIFKDSSLEDSIDLWLSASQERYAKLASSEENPNSLSPSERLALASMVEAECLGGRYHKEAATVFLNRLADGSNLQSCVTAEYALGYQRPYLTIEDTEIESEYNTYQSAGLPPGPICSVSDSSLRASLGQGNGSDIYFFYYDYILDEMMFFSDYEEFQSQGSISIQRFKDNSDVDMFEKINKQSMFDQNRKPAV